MSTERYYRQYLVLIVASFDNHSFVWNIEKSTGLISRPTFFQSDSFNWNYSLVEHGATDVADGEVVFFF